MAAVISTTFELDLKQFMESLKLVSTESQATTEKLKEVFTGASKDLEDKKIKLDVDVKPPDNVEKVGTSMKEKILSGFKGIDEQLKGSLGGILAVAGGSLLAKGIEGVVGSFGGLVEKGKASLQATQNLEIAFATAGIKGAQLNAAVSGVSKSAVELSNRLAMPIGYIREFSQTAAAIGGATGKANTDLTMLAVGIEKATNGMVSGNMAIRLFSKGISDPESSFALGRLTKQFPALGAALKEAKEPADAMQKALEFLGPTFKMVEAQSNSPIGAMERLQNNLNMIKSSLGRVIIDAIAPFIEAFSKNMVPVIQSVVGWIKSLSGVIAPLRPVFMAAGTGLAFLVTGILALKGLSMFASLAADAAKFGLSILQTVIPALVTETVVTDAAGVSTTSLSLAKNALTFATIKDAAAKGVNAVVTGAMTIATTVATAAQWALNAAFLASPIGWIVLGVGALIAGLILLYNNVEPVRRAFDGAWTLIKIGATYAWEIIKKLGSALLAFGELVFTYVTLPFQIFWGIISEVGSAIWGLVQSLFGAGDAASSSAGGMQFLTDVFNATMTGLNYLIAAIKGAIAWIQSIASSVGSAIGKLFSGDFVGAAKAITGAGEKAGQAFNEGFTKEMNKLKWEDATKTMKEAISQASTIKLEIGSENKDKTAGMVDEYKKTMSQIDELRAKQASGGGLASMSDEDKKKLLELEAQAQSSAKEIGKLAPATRENFRTVVDEAGNLSQVWDINIEKAQEFSKSGETTALQGQVNSYSSALSEQAIQITNLIDKQKSKQAEIDKETDPKKKQALIDKYNDEKKEIDKNKDAMVEAFKQGAINGLLTEGAIANVASALGITSDEAKKMALGEVLKDAMAKGAMTESQIQKIADRFGYTTDQVKGMIEEQKKSTAEAQATADAALSIGDAYEESAKKAKEAADKSVKNLAGLRAEREGLLKRGASEQELKENKEKIDAEIAAGKQNAKYYKKTEDITKSAKEEIYGKEEKKGKSTGGDKENIDLGYMQELSKVYADKDKVEQDARKRSNENAVKALEDKKKAIVASAATDEEKLVQTVAIEKEISLLQEKIEIEGIETRTKQAIVKSRQALVQKLGAEKANKKIYEDYMTQKSGIDADSTLTDEERLNKLADLDDAYFATLLKNSKANAKTKEAIEKGYQQARTNGEQEAETAIKETHGKYNSQRATAEAEANKKINEATLKEQKELLNAQLKNSNVYSEEAIKEKKKLQQKLLEIEYADVIKKDPKDRTAKDVERYKEYQDKIRALDYEALNASADLEKDEQKKKLEKSILSIEEQLQKELASTQATEDEKVKAVEEAEKKIAALRRQYWLENNQAARMATNFQAALLEEMNDKTAEAAREQNEQKKKELADERKDLEKQLRENTISYKDYAGRINDLNKRQAEVDSQTKSRGAILEEKLAKAATKTFGKETDKKKKEIDELDKKGEDSSKARVELLGMEAAQQLAQGQLTLASAGGLVIDAMASWLTTMIPVWTAGIFGSSVGELGPILGVVAAAGLTAAMLGLAETAKSSLGAEGGYFPGYKGYQNRPGRKDTKHVMVTPNEAIVPEDITAREAGLLKFLFAGGTSEEYFNQHIAQPSAIASLATMPSTVPNQRMDSSISSSAYAQADLAGRFDKAMAMQRNINVKTSSEHSFSPLRISKDEITAEVVKSHNSALTKF